MPPNPRFCFFSLQFFGSEAKTLYVKRVADFAETTSTAEQNRLQCHVVFTVEVKAEYVMCEVAIKDDGHSSLHERVSL